MTLIPSVAILGAGFAGLAVGYYLSQKLKCKITFYDPLGPGGAASSISAGILHKYGGLHAKKNPFADQGEQATLDLLNIVSSSLDKSPVLAKGILRLALNEKQLVSYKKCVELYKDVHWVPAEESQSFYPYVPKKPGIFIPDGLVIDAKTYLEGLFRLIQPAQFISESTSTKAALAQHDLIIYAMGPNTPLVKTTAVKGQLIELEWPKKLPPLPIGLVSQVYVCQNRTNDRAYVGATYEHQFRDSAPDQEKALQELLPKAFELLPDLKDARIITVKAALRASTPDHLPIFGKISPREWYLSGLGSKGLLYHALYAKQLVDLILNESD